MKSDDEIRKDVRERYAGFATAGSSCCGGATPAREQSARVGYTAADLAAAPPGANLGLGCGNPVALAALNAGETVLDLGAGAGFDCFLAARRVGPHGHVIGVDMTPEMLERARANARSAGLDHVEFRLGEIEHLPAADASVDAVISNCVINLSPAKDRVFAEAFRVLRPGGRLLVSDLVLRRELPVSLRRSIEAYVGCVAGADLRAAYLAKIAAAGFAGVEVVEETAFPVELAADDPIVRRILAETRLAPDELRAAAAGVLSVKVRAVKPAAPAPQIGQVTESACGSGGGGAGTNAASAS